MPKPPAFQFYAKDFLSSPSIRTMSLEAEGAYIHLLATAWDSDPVGTLPKDQEKLRLLSRASRKIWRRVWREIKPLWESYNDARICNPRLVEEYAKLSNYTETKRLAGIEGAKRRWHTHTSAIGKPIANDSSASATAFASTTALKATPKPYAREPQGFLLFWENYPEAARGFKPDALLEWARIPSSEMHFGDILQSLELWKSSDRWQDEQYIPEAKNFLRTKKWSTRPPKSESEKNDEVIRGTIARVVANMGSTARKSS